MGHSLIRGGWLCAALFVTVLLGADAARADTINFDDVSIPGSAVSTEISATRYQSRGVLISATAGFGPYVGLGANGSSNFLFASQSINGPANGGISVRFVLPGTFSPGVTDSVSFMVVGTDSSQAALWSAAIFNPDGTLLETRSGSTDGLVNFLRAQADIARVEFYPSVFREGIDDLTFGNISTANPVPEPATLLLFGMGLSGVAGAVRRRRRAAGR
jgi:hypothetical protein